MLPPYAQIPPPVAAAAPVSGLRRPPRRPRPAAQAGSRSHSGHGQRCQLGQGQRAGDPGDVHRPAVPLLQTARRHHRRAQAGLRPQAAASGDQAHAPALPQAGPLCGRGGPGATQAQGGRCLLPIHHRGLWGPARRQLGRRRPHHRRDARQAPAGDGHRHPWQAGRRRPGPGQEDRRPGHAQLLRQRRAAERRPAEGEARRGHRSTARGSSPWPKRTSSCPWPSRRPAAARAAG